MSVSLPDGSEDAFAPSEIAESEIQPYDDGKFVRSAVVVPEKGVSFDLLDSRGLRIGEINAFVYYDEDTFELSQVIIDVIDKDDLFRERRALAFKDGNRSDLSTGKVTSVDWRERL